jgi:hypothetical protein
MQSFTIAIINENKIRLQDRDRNEKNLSDDNLESLLEDYIEFKKVNNVEEMMLCITKVLGDTSNLYATTSNCFINKDYVYQITHLVDNNKPTNNYIATSLLQEEHNVYKSCVLMKSKRVDDNYINESITMNDIIDIYRKVYKHIGLLIKPNKEITEINYYNNPLDGQTPDKVKNSKYYEFLIAEDKVIQMFIEIDPIINQLNEIATIFYQKPIYGEVLIGFRNRGSNLYSSTEQYIDLDKDLFNKLLCVRSFYDTESDESIDNKTMEDVKLEKRTLIPFEIQLDRKYYAYKHKYGTSYSTKKLENIMTHSSLQELTKELISKNTT